MKGGFASYSGGGSKESPDAESVAGDDAEGGEPSDDMLTAMAGKKAFKAFRMALESGDDAAGFKAYMALDKACSGE